jgi:hypothetical protein
MSLNAQEELQIARIVAQIVDARLDQMTKEISVGFVEIANGMMEDLAKILEGRAGEMSRLLEARMSERNNRPKAGFR